jgi:flagellar biosynthesis/type III secretory pathway chaperone
MTRNEKKNLAHISISLGIMAALLQELYAVSDRKLNGANAEHILEQVQAYCAEIFAEGRNVSDKMEQLDGIEDAYRWLLNSKQKDFHEKCEKLMKINQRHKKILRKK